MRSSIRTSAAMVAVLCAASVPWLTPGPAAAGTTRTPSHATTAAPTVERVPPAPFATWTAVVDDLYGDLLDRSPTPSERSSAAAALESGAWTIGDLAADLRASDDHTLLVGPAVRLYRASLGRAPDPGGYAFWTARRRSGSWTLTTMASHLAGSSEFQRRFGVLANRDYVERIYANVLGRASDPAGAAFWTQQLDRGRYGRGHALAAISESGEHRRRTEHDLTTDVLFLSLLRRLPTATERARVTDALRDHLTPAWLADAIVADREHARLHGHTGPHVHHLTVAPDGSPADGDSFIDVQGSATADASSILFLSTATTLASVPSEPQPQLYLWQRFTGIRWLDLGLDGTEHLVAADLADDARTLAYATVSDRTTSISLVDLGSGERTLIDARPTGAETDLGLSVQLSADGRHVVWSTEPAGDDQDPAAQQVRTWDRATGAVTVVSLTPQGDPGNGRSRFAAIDGDGSTIAFTSSATDLTDVPGTDGEHLYVWERATRQLRRVPAPAPTTGAAEDASAWLPRISDDGRTVAYWRLLDPAGQPNAQIVHWRVGEAQSAVIDPATPPGELRMGLGLSADGGSILHHDQTSSGDPVATRRDLATGASMTIAAFGDRANDRLALSGDGRLALVNTTTALAPATPTAPDDGHLYLIDPGT